MSGRITAAALALLVATSASAQQAPRSVVPIREIDIRPIGTPRYAIEVVVNGAPMVAGLDTGSTGLRLLPRAVARSGVAPDGPPESYSYGSGVELEGHRAGVDVAIGAARGRATIQAVQRVVCVARQPDCPASRVASDDYGLMGSGQPGQGFPAIIGVRLAPGRIGNPLPAMGIRRWIVHLPLRGGGEGALILNPDERDAAGFVPLRAGAGVPGTVAACVMIARPDAQRFCGPTLLDTGAPGLAIRGATRPAGWQPGLPGRLTFYTLGGDGPAVGFRTGDQATGATTRFVTSQSGERSLSAGTLPFYAYDVLFDQEHDVIAVRPRLDGGSGDVRPLHP